MQKALVASLTVLLLVVFAAPAEAGRKRKRKKYGKWDLNIVFVVGSEDQKTSAGKERIESFIKKQVKYAESTFKTRPKLDINYKVTYRPTLGGKDLANPTFKNNREYRKWMDRYGDNVANSKTSGHMTVVVVDSFCIKNKKRKRKKTGKTHKCPGGRAWFPHWVNPFNRKTGIALRYRNEKYTLAHEIGHFLSLKHTFERYVNINPKLNCNTDYKKGKKGHCSSCKGKTDGEKCDGKSNVMDYCSASRQYLNSCQKRRASNQRYKYMTRKGKTNYRRLTGLR